VSKSHIFLMNDIRRVLIVGGGVGGLTAAAAFGGRGAEVTLIEKRPAFDVPGVGLGQPANALRVYDALGVLPEILDSGFIYDHMSIFDSQRKLIARHDFLLGDERIPAVCALSRRRLHDILLAAAEKAGADVRLGLTVRGIDDRGDKVGIEFSDGSTDIFDLVAGFDGIRSEMRKWLVGSAFVPRPSGYGAWRVQVPRPDYVDGMEFLQGIGSKTGAMPLSDDLMYVFHIRPEAPDAFFERADMVDLFQTRLAQYGSYVADVRDQLNEQSDIVYSPIEPMLLPWPWFRGRIVIGGDAAHTVPPHLTQGAAMAAEDGYILAKEVLESSEPIEARLMAYSQKRYARAAFVYAFSRQWLEDEQSVRTPADLEMARADMAQHASARVGASDRILNSRVF
jgi:2-polyprenyl-6-methoxyphenol hydroxylase-like FAD-dependent oxidoreductase